MEQPILHAIAVNYLGSAHVAALVESFRRQNNPEWRLTIVDNSESPRELTTLGEIASTDPRVKVFASPENLGYFGAARWVMQQPNSSVGRWTAVCNVDLVLANDDFVGLLSDRGDDPEVIAPSIKVVDTGREQNPYMSVRPSMRSMRLRRFVFRHRAVAACAYAWADRKGKPSAVQSRSGSSIYAAHGAFLLLNHRYFERGGSLEHGPFLFAEEITIAETCRRLGMTVAYDPRIQVLHDEHQATGMQHENAMRLIQREATAYAYDLVARG